MQEIELKAKALPGLHEKVFQLWENQIKKPSKVLDLASGTGAWALRLHQNGYQVTGTDLNKEDFQVPDIPFTQSDLNKDFSDNYSESFDVVSAIEIIEHLENPRHFLRQCHKLLKPDGRLMVTTPNIECLMGRIRFLRNGHFRMFGRDPKFNDMTHITPIQSFMFEKAAADAGFDIVSHEFNNPTVINRGFVKKVLETLLNPFTSGIKGGDIHIYFLRKK